MRYCLTSDRRDKDLFWEYQINDKETFAVSWTLKEGQSEEQARVDWILTTARKTTVGGLVVGNATLKDAVDRYGWWATTRARTPQRMTLQWPGLVLTFDAKDVLDAVVVIPRDQQPTAESD